MTAPKRKLRSSHWFGGADKNTFIHRSWMRNQGIAPHQFEGKPIIGICNTFSELTPCNAHFRQLAEHVKRGVLEAGGFPLEFPVFSNGESNLRPMGMLTRNLARMEEEAIRGNPVDSVILLAGCDKTTPALLMGASSCDVPAMLVSGGPMLIRIDPAPIPAHQHSIQLQRIHETSPSWRTRPGTTGDAR